MFIFNRNIELVVFLWGDIHFLNTMQNYAGYFPRNKTMENYTRKMRFLHFLLSPLWVSLWFFFISALAMGCIINMHNYLVDY